MKTSSITKSLCHIISLSVMVAFACAVCMLSPSSGRAAVTSQTIAFFSKSLDRPTTYIAILPDGYDDGTSYPVLYLLHGATGGFRDWDTLAPIEADLAPYRMIVITPDGGQFGWYLDSKIKPDSRYESFITRDLIENVDSRFHTVADRSGRGIAGLSMGGHGALSLAAKHPELFSSASSMSGIVKITNHPKSWHLPDILGPLEKNRAEWEANSVYELANRFTTAGVALLFDCGNKDATGATKDNAQLDERLKHLHITHLYHQYPGGHTWDYWRTHVPEHFAFHAKNFSEKAKLQKHP